MITPNDDILNTTGNNTSAPVAPHDLHPDFDPTQADSNLALEVEQYIELKKEEEEVKEVKEKEDKITAENNLISAFKEGNYENFKTAIVSLVKIDCDKSKNTAPQILHNLFSDRKISDSDGTHSFLEYALSKKAELTDDRQNIFSILFKMLGDKLIAETKEGDPLLRACTAGNKTLVQLLVPHYKQIAKALPDKTHFKTCIEKAKNSTDDEEVKTLLKQLEPDAIFSPRIRSNLNNSGARAPTIVSASKGYLKESQESDDLQNRISGLLSNSPTTTVATTATTATTKTEVKTEETETPEFDRSYYMSSFGWGVIASIVIVEAVALSLFFTDTATGKDTLGKVFNSIANWMWESICGASGLPDKGQNAGMIALGTVMFSTAAGVGGAAVGAVRNYSSPSK